MGNLKHKHISEDQYSNSSVLNLSLESNKEIKKDLLIKEDFNSDIINELKNEVTIPIENEYIESTEFSLEGKEEEYKIKFFFENILDEDIVHKKRSKTFVPIVSYKNAPRPLPKESSEYISPLKLSIKSYGIIPKWNIKPNSVLFDFQKNFIDSKSCNDEESFDDFFYINTNTERTTPNTEDLHDLLDCRKKMTYFRNSINDRMSKEYENILSSDNIFNESKEDININNHFHQKKNNFWNKYIRQQQLKEKNKMHTFRIPSDSMIKISDSNCENEKNKKDQGLFILGILESAAKEKKRRNTVNV